MPVRQTPTENAGTSTRKKRGPPTEKRKLQNRESQRKFRQKLKSRPESTEATVELLIPQVPSSVRNHHDAGLEVDFERQHFPKTASVVNLQAPSKLEHAMKSLIYPESPATTNPPLQNIDDLVFDSDPNILYDLTSQTGLSSSHVNQFWTTEGAPHDVTKIPELFILQPHNGFLDTIGAAQLLPSSSSGHERVLTMSETHRASLLPGIYNLNMEISSTAAVDFDESQSAYQTSDQLSTSTVSTSEPKSHLEIYSNLRKQRISGTDDLDTKMLAQDLIRHLRLDDTKENKCLISTAIARGHNIRDVLLAGLQALGSNSTMQSVRRNTLSLVQASTLRAFLTNASAVKMHIPDLYIDSTESPFYRPDRPPDCVQSLVAQYKAFGIPTNLCPTAIQILRPHKPWVDLIPFPVMRERTLTLSSMEPPMIDLQELKEDIMLGNGLICWQFAGVRDSTNPWDWRSWEAEEWFLRKWWILVGGEEADVWRQTKWWRQLRGEKTLELGWK